MGNIFVQEVSITWRKRQENSLNVSYHVTPDITQDCCLTDKQAACYRMQLEAFKVIRIG